MTEKIDTELLTILDHKLKQELKDLINEVLDERELEKKLNGPYDVPEQVAYAYRLDEIQE